MPTTIQREREAASSGASALPSTSPASPTSTPPRRCRARCRRVRTRRSAARRPLHRADLRDAVHRAARHNRRSWLYRIRPGALHRPSAGSTTAPPSDLQLAPPPNRLRWDPLPIPATPHRLRRGLGHHGRQRRCRRAARLRDPHLRREPVDDRPRLLDADGELLIVPQPGRLLLAHRARGSRGRPGEIAVVPRGVRFPRGTAGGAARGYVCENFGAPFRLPELGPIGANGLANPRDFRAPGRGLRGREGDVRGGQQVRGQPLDRGLDHSPLDVVAWHGNYAPYAYDLARFNALGTVSFDHPDPSIFTVLHLADRHPGPRPTSTS